MVESASRAVPVIAAGVQQLGLRPLDPLLLERIGASQAGLDMDFRNTQVKGLSNCRILNLSRQAQRLSLETQCSVQLGGEYRLGGRLLVLPVEGEGRYRIRIQDIVVKLELGVGVERRGAHEHWRLASWRHSARVLTGADFHFQNLFRGNKQLSDAVHQFANSNWREIFQEVAPPIVKAVVAGVVEETSKLFEKVPLSELILD
ncbi:Protein takeout [Eumeta japonica]|uniref:Protein takeout n=1 Tax=Eumeta variegata TaxID=151549 RepID=A0A4C1Y0S8_EUMVA|nr:Protein takeout [Eumeta japonica]